MCSNISTCSHYLQSITISLKKEDDKNMKDMKLSEVVERSVQIRKLYHQLEKQYHEKEWTVEEDALAFLQMLGW